MVKILLMLGMKKNTRVYEEYGSMMIKNVKMNRMDRKILIRNNVITGSFFNSFFSLTIQSNSCMNSKFLIVNTARQLFSIVDKFSQFTIPFEGDYLKL